MKHLLVSFLGMGGIFLAGCPIYGESGYTQSGPTNSSGTCSAPSDCPSGSTCSSAGYCSTGKCDLTGCVAGYECQLSGGRVQCVKQGLRPDAGNVGCSSDSACSQIIAGSKCLDGTCVAPADQCSDATQCKGTAQCVQGVCTPKCDSSHPCATGYSCDNNGLCTGNPNPCGTNGVCSGGNICVSEHCVQPCGTGNTCASGLVCVGGGCVPDQKPNFVCGTEGVQDACAKGSLCLHHNCYIACSLLGDAGADSGNDAGADGGGTCQNADKFTICKHVSTASGAYSVCGSDSNLGSDCDPTQGKACAAPAVCIDGFCR